MGDIKPERTSEISNRGALGRLLLSSFMIAGSVLLGENQESSSAKIALFVIGVVAIAGISTMLFMHSVRGVIPKKKDLIDLFLGLGFISFYVYVPVYFGSRVLLIANDISEYSISSTAQIAYAIPVLVFLAGSLLFIFRLKFRFVYGFTEVLVGMYFAYAKIRSEGSIPFSFEISETMILVIVTGAIYLVVRGLDNMHQGMTKEKDPIGIFVLAWFESVGNQPDSIKQEKS